MSNTIHILNCPCVQRISTDRRSPSVTRVICTNCRLEIVHVYTIYNQHPLIIAYRSMLHSRRVLTANLAPLRVWYTSKVSLECWVYSLVVWILGVCPQQNTGPTCSWKLVTIGPSDTVHLWNLVGLLDHCVTKRFLGF